MQMPYQNPSMAFISNQIPRNFDQKYYILGMFRPYFPEPPSQMLSYPAKNSIQLLNGFQVDKSYNNPSLVSDQKVRSARSGQVSVSLGISGKADVKGIQSVIKILSYNVWFREDLEVVERMQAIGYLIELHSPDVICFQEVTPIIYNILQRSAWWGRYRCSLAYERIQSSYFCMQLSKLPVQSFSCKKFSYTAMGRELCLAHIEVDENKSVVVATSHLESVCLGPPTWDQTYSKERVQQAREALRYLEQYSNVIFCGDMNWDEKLDGQYPLTEGWLDAWENLRPSEVGWTYDMKSNKMLGGYLQKRLDRFICRLRDFEVSSIDMVGTEAIPGLTYSKQKKMKGKIKEATLPVYPSDHYGLVLTMTGK